MSETRKAIRSQCIFLSTCHSSSQPACDQGAPHIITSKQSNPNSLGFHRGHSTSNQYTPRKQHPQEMCSLCFFHLIRLPNPLYLRHRQTYRSSAISESRLNSIYVGARNSPFYSLIFFCPDGRVLPLFSPAARQVISVCFFHGEGGDALCRVCY